MSTAKLEEERSQLKQRQELVEQLNKLKARTEALADQHLVSKSAHEEASARLADAKAARKRKLALIERDQAVGERLEELISESGKRYEEVVITEISDIGISFKHKNGSARIPASDLSVDWHDRFEFAEDAATQLRAEEHRQARNLARLAREAESERSSSEPKTDPSAGDSNASIDSETGKTASKPVGRVKLLAKTVSTKTQRNSWSQAWGAIDQYGAIIVANAGREKVTRRVVGVTLTCPSDSHGGDYVVEMYWFGFPLDKKSKRYVCSAAIRTITMKGDSRQTIAIASDYNYTDESLLYLESDSRLREWKGLYVREWSGYTYAGWAVRISDGNGQIVAQQGAQPSFLRHLESVPVPRKK